MDFLTPGNLIAIVLLALACGVLLSSIRIAQENERFAVFMMGRFVRYAGPGLVLKSMASQFVRLRVGDIGSVTSHEFANFGGVDIPVSNLASFDTGDPVRIKSFDDTEPRLVKSALRPKTKCPACGHEF